MDLPSSDSTLDGPSKKIQNTTASLANASSSTSNVASAKPGPSNAIRKHIIRRLTPLDLQKLQQAGLDRKIAEALSKHKSEQRNKALNQAAGDLKATANKGSYTGATSSTVSKPTNVKDAASAKKPVIIYKRKPPLITITGPDGLSEIEKQQLANLNPQQRLVQVKNLLNKKLLEKGGPEINDTVKTKQHLKQPAELSQSPHTKPPQAKPAQEKPVQEKPPPKKLYSILKQPPEDTQTNDDSRLTKPEKKIKAPTTLTSTLTPTSVKPTQKKNPQNSPQDIARKLDFQTDLTETEAAHPSKKQNIKCLNKNVVEIPKTSVKAANSQQQNKSLPIQGEGILPPKQSYYVINTVNKATNFQYEYIKQQQQQLKISQNNIPKASIKNNKNKEQFSSLFSKQLKRSEQKLNLPEVSPLKVNFPTVNVPKETPLPTIDSFKKPYSAYYEPQHTTGDQSDLILTNYETSLFNQEPITTAPCLTRNQQPTTSQTPQNFVYNQPTTSSLANSLIVLENKILSQDEMIDLTELRLSTSKFDRPGFITPHRPIPEVVIKQEKTDEYPETDKSTAVGMIKKKDLQRQNNDKVSSDKFPISNKQNKRVIINTQKLKLTTEQLTELDKKMKQQTSTTSLPATIEINQANKVQDVSIQNANAASGPPLNKHLEYVSIENRAQTINETPHNFMINHAPIYYDVQDHNYQYKQTEQDYFMAGQPHVINEALMESNNQSAFETFPNYYTYDQPQNTLDTTYFEVSENCANIKHEAVEIVDEPIEAENCFSAVDFILSLGNTNPITEERGLEISPEEHNLNASCAINLSPIRKQSIKELTSYRTSTAKMSTNQNDKSLKSQQNSCIAVGTTKSPLAAPTYERPIKSVTDLKSVNKLQTVTTANLGDSNLVVCDMDIEEPSENLLIEMNQKKRDDLLENINKSSTEFKQVLYSDSNSNPLNLSQNVTNSKTLLKSCIKKADFATTTSKPFDNELSSTNINDVTKFPPEIPASKTSEMSSNTTVTTKRISKFKKGKINLVQRNKTGQAPNSKTLAEDQKIVVNKSGNETLNSEHKIDSENNQDAKTSEKTLIELYNEMFTIPNQTNETTPPTKEAKPNMSANEMKGTNLAKKSDFHAIEITDNKLLTPMATVHSAVNSLTEIQSSPLQKEVIPQQINIKTNPQKLELPQTSLTSKDIKTILIKSPDITINKPLRCDTPDISNALQQHKNSTEIPPKKITATKAAAEQTNKCQDDIQITQYSADITTQIDSNKIHTSRTQESLAENLTPQSKTTLANMKTAKISLIDIVKHSPTKPTENCPVIPFKKTNNESSEKPGEVKGIKTLINQLKSSNSNEKDIQESMEEQTLMANRCSRRSLSTSQTETPPPSNVSTRKRHSTRLLITDDELEFLPANAEIKFKISKSKLHEKNNEHNEEVDLTTEKHDTGQSLYSQSLEAELFNIPSCSRRRNRYYSQSLETNVTITFDALKSKETLPTNLKPMETEESCPNSTQDSCTITSTKQRKKFRKTIKETKQSYNDTDSDDDNRDYDCAMRDCEESNEFLGFDDNPESATIKNTQNVIKETEHEATTKHGTLKNWLTTGKAISPTIEKKSRRRLRHEDELTELSSSSPPVTSDTKEQKPLKKRWNFSSLPHDETDITDDTSPADDEEDINEPISIRKKFKRGIENVIDSNNKLIDSKKTKLDDSIEQSFVKPQNVKVKAKHSYKHSDCQEEKAGTSQKPHTGTEPDCHEENCSKAQRFQVNTEKSGTDSDGQKCEKSSDYKSKDKADNIKKPNDTSESNERNKVDNTEKVREVGNRSKSKENANVDVENLSNIPQQQDVTTIPENLNGKNENSREQDVDPLREVEGINSEKSLIVRIKPEPDSSFVTPQNITNKRKRGRPKRSIIYDSSEDEGPSTSTSGQSLEVPTKRKLKIEDSDDSDPLSTFLNKTPATTPRSRKTKQTIESNFNSRLLLITKREQLDTDEILTETETGSGSIQCGLCLKYTHPPKWSLHLTEHYGVGWIVGQEKLHIENRNVVINTILRYLKDGGANEIRCRMCKKVYRSALGIITHIEGCGAETIRVTCEFCNRHYAKTSLPAHLRSCLLRNSRQNQSCSENQDEGNGEQEVIGNSGRLKRHSTIKAENKLKVLGEELEKVTDTVKSDIDPKLRIRYVEPLSENFCGKWSKDIMELGTACCPKALCKFSSNDIKALSAHIKECKFMKSGYICNFCRRIYQSENEAIAHVVKSHQNRRRDSNDSDCGVKTVDEQSSDDNDLSEGVDENELTDGGAGDEEDVEDIKANSKKGSRTRKRSTLMQTSRKTVFDGRHNDLDSEVLKKWIRFIKSNYSCEPLYSEFTPNYSVLKHQDFSKYLPTQTVSMKYSFGTKTTLISTVGVPQKNIEWSELKRYESINNKMNTYFFLGAPVKLCSWLPLPAHVNEQYLAVVYRPDMFKFIKFTKPKQHPSIVLILKVTRNRDVPELNIHYGFVVNDGPIHHISFLPSGGYDEASNRLGLVAVATVNSCINVYSLPLNVEDNSSSKENITLIGIKPSFILNLDIFDEKAQEQQHVVLNPQCLQICWSEYSHHQHIFAGFSNGFVAIWEILNDPQENINHFLVDGVTNYVPLNYFYIGEKSVKLALHYDTSGPRWLAASSAYRKFVIYDLKNFMQPIIMKEDVHKNILLSLDWCPVWENPLCTYCDTLQNNGRLLLAVSPNNIMFPHYRIDTVAAGITQVHYTPLTNLCVTASNNGDIAILDTRELHYEYILGRKFGEKRALYCMDVKQLNGEPLVMLAKGNKKNDDIPSDWIMHDTDYKEKYGVIFQPLVKIKDSDRKIYADENRAPPVNMIPLMRINTLRWNLNLNCKELIALGYENGFLRLVNLQKRNIFRD